MAKSTLSRHGKSRVAALLSLSGLVLAACSAASEQPAPVYTVRIVSSGIPETAASGPVMREMAGPVALAPSLAPPTAMAHPSSDVIPLDTPPPQPPPAKQPSEPVTLAAAPPPQPAPTPMPKAGPAPMPALVAAPSPAAPPATLPPMIAAPRAEPSAAELARAEAASPPVRGPISAESAMADIATPGAVMPVKADRARYRPRYYYSP